MGFELCLWTDWKARPGECPVHTGTRSSRAPTTAPLGFLLGVRVRVQAAVLSLSK